MKILYQIIDFCKFNAGGVSPSKNGVFYCSKNFGVSRDWIPSCPLFSGLTFFLWIQCMMFSRLILLDSQNLRAISEALITCFDITSCKREAHSLAKTSTYSQESLIMERKDFAKIPWTMVGLNYMLEVSNLAKEKHNHWKIHPLYNRTLWSWKGRILQNT